jgi:hypothetical protein
MLYTHSQVTEGGREEPGTGGMCVWGRVLQGAGAWTTR